MKFQPQQDGDQRKRSHPSRGGWIEMMRPPCLPETRRRPTPRGVGGLKLVPLLVVKNPDAVPPLAGWVD